MLDSQHQGLPKGWRRYTFSLTEELLENIKNYAYWKRMHIKYVHQKILEEFFKDKIIPPRKEKKELQNKIPVHLLSKRKKRRAKNKTIITACLTSKEEKQLKEIYSNRKSKNKSEVIAEAIKLLHQNVGINSKDKKTNLEDEKANEEEWSTWPST